MFPLSLPPDTQKETAGLNSICEEDLLYFESTAKEIETVEQANGERSRGWAVFFYKNRTGHRNYMFSKSMQNKISINVR